jgi:anti-sigma28 factor (negative regulator of flagellin synthesis)
MKIRKGWFIMAISNLNSALSAYGTQNGFEAVKKEAAGAAPAAKNVDKADFTSVLSKSRSLESLKNDIKGAVDALASPERLEHLKQLVAKGEYNIPPELVAASIFAS